MTSPPLVLVEPGADRYGGHHHRTLVALASAYTPVTVVAPDGITSHTAAALDRAGAVVVTGPAGMAGKWLWGVGRTLRGLALLLRVLLKPRWWPVRVRRIPYQVLALALCAIEAAGVRTGRRHAGVGACPVVLSAASSLAAVAGLLGGRHIRIVHELSTREDAPLRALQVLAGAGWARVITVAPTAAVARQVHRRYRRLEVRVRPFAVACAGERIRASERRTARDALGIAAAAKAVAVIGGWWPYKDIAVIDTALQTLPHRLHVLVAGNPVDSEVVGAWSVLQHLEVHHVPGRLDETQIRGLYAAADAVIAARHPGIQKESGLITDAIRLGLPLIVSDHDPILTARLRHQDWAAVFPAGDAAGLQGALLRLCAGALSPPPVEATAHMGIPDPRDQARYYLSLTPKGSR